MLFICWSTQGVVSQYRTSTTTQHLPVSGELNRRVRVWEIRWSYSIITSHSTALLNLNSSRAWSLAWQLYLMEARYSLDEVTNNMWQRNRFLLASKKLSSIIMLQTAIQTFRFVALVDVFQLTADLITISRYMVHVGIRPHLFYTKTD